MPPTLPPVKKAGASAGGGAGSAGGAGAASSCGGQHANGGPALEYQRQQRSGYKIKGGCFSFIYR